MKTPARIILRNPSEISFEKMSLEEKLKVRKEATKLAEAEGCELEKIDRTNGDIFLVRRNA